MILVDAGPLVAIFDRRQPQHQACLLSLAELELPLVTTWPAFAEAMYLLGKAGAWPAQDLLWQFVIDSNLLVRCTPTEEHTRLRALMAQYRDRPMDLADASLVAAAEAMGAKRVLTLDSDFHIYRLHGRESLEVIRPL